MKENGENVDKKCLKHENVKIDVKYKLTDAAGVAVSWVRRQNLVNVKNLRHWTYYNKSSYFLFSTMI